MRDPLARERGWALVSVLWAVAILSMMAAATEALTVTSARIEQRTYDQARIDADIHAAVVRAILALDDPRLTARWRIDGVPQTFAFDRLPMTISVQDESGFIDLNNADQSTLAGLFVSQGVPAATAQNLAANIDDWRDPIGEDSDRQQGTTDGKYVSAGLGYAPRHDPFQTLDELKLVIGMTPALYAQVAPALTIYSRDSNVDEDTAPLFVLAALYPNDPKKLADALAARNNPQQAGDQAAQPQSPPGVLPASSTSWGHSYRVTVAAIPNGRRIVRTAVVEPTGNPDRPYLVESWR